MAKSWDVIGYTWLADTWCPGCTIKARDEGRLTCEQYGGHAGTPDPGEDCHGLAYGLADREGNLLHPIFADAEPQLRDDGSSMGLHCGGCGGQIMEGEPEDEGEPEQEPEGFAEFFDGYVTAALWSSTDDEGNPLDDQHGPEDIGNETDKMMREDCADFMRDNAADIAEMMGATGRPMDHMGHDFWLTRNGHGAGFWDRGAGAVGDRLTKAAKSHGGVDLIIGADGMIHGC